MKLRDVRMQRKVTAKQLGKMCGVTESTITMIETGARKPSYDLLLRLAECLDCIVSDIVGDAELADQGFSQRERNLIMRFRTLDDYGKRVVNAVMDVEQTEQTIDFGTIRKYLSRPAAGLGGLVAGEDYEDIPRTAETPRDADFALVVSGDSMEPYIHDGETIYITEKAALDPMDVGVFCVDGETYVKQYAPSYDGSVYLLSANPERENANVYIRSDSNRSMQYFGKVILPKKLPAPVYR